MEDAFAKFCAGLIVMLVMAAFGLLFAFPVMWCWNYAVVAVWNLPAITWGQAWCLLFLSGSFIKSNLFSINKR